MSLLMLSCNKATELIEKKIYFRLSLPERLKLIFHTRNCEVCLHYQKQSIWLDRVLRVFLVRKVTVNRASVAVLPHDFKNHIIKKIEST